jgi:hypothetical protein
MLTLPVFRKALPLAALLVTATFTTVALETAVAQQQGSSGSSGERVFTKPHRGPVIGGTSWTLSDVWGEPKMPEPSNDYPGYDYTPGGYTLNGPPSQSPYPN